MVTSARCSNAFRAALAAADGDGAAVTVGGDPAVCGTVSLGTAGNNDSFADRAPKWSRVARIMAASNVEPFSCFCGGTAVPSAAVRRSLSAEVLGADSEVLSTLADGKGPYVAVSMVAMQ